MVGNAGGKYAVQRSNEPALAIRVKRRGKSYSSRGHNRRRPLLHNTERNVYLATQAIRFKSKSSLTLQLAR